MATPTKQTLAKTVNKPGMPSKPEPAGLAIPEHLKQFAGDRSGFEQADQSDFILPRLAICQSLSPQRKKNDPKFIEGLTEGMLFNTLSGQIYDQPLKFIPLFLAKNRIKFKVPVGTGIDCQSLNGKTGGRLSPASCLACPHSQFGEDGKRPACDEFKGLVSLLDDGSLIAVSTKSTGLSKTKELLSKLRLRNLPMFGSIVEVKVVDETKNNNTYGTWEFTPVGFTPEKLFGQAQQFFESLKDKNVILDTDGDEGDDAAGFDTGRM
jgi:hypothetical protein